MRRLSERQIRQLLTMHFGAGTSTWTIGRELGMAPSTVRKWLSRASATGIVWPLAADVTDESLTARLFANAGVRAVVRYHAESDWAPLVRRLKRPASTYRCCGRNIGRFTRRGILASAGPTPAPGWIDPFDAAPSG